MPPRSFPINLVGVLLGVAACSPGQSSEADLPPDATSLYALVQTVDGTSLYPPLGPEPTPTGTFDATLLGALHVVLESTDAAGVVRPLATFDRGSSPALVLLAAHELYWVNVPAARYITDPASSYRFRILLDGPGGTTKELGLSDLGSHIFTVMRYVPDVPIGVKIRVEGRPSPAVSAVSASCIPHGADLALTIEGSRFARDSVVRVGGEVVPSVWRSPTSLTAAVPGSVFGGAASYDVTVTTPAPGGGTSAALAIDDARIGLLCDTGLLGVCAHGTTTCAGGAVTCTPATAPQAEVCDGLDDDCDGQVDDGLALAGGWTDWSAWTACSATCGGGTQTRTRSCSSPAPVCGGATCSGPAEETQSCNTAACNTLAPATYTAASPLALNRTAPGRKDFSAGVAAGVKAPSYAIAAWVNIPAFRVPSNASIYSRSYILRLGTYASMAGPYAGAYFEMGIAHDIYGNVELVPATYLMQSAGGVPAYQTPAGAVSTPFGPVRLGTVSPGAWFHVAVEVAIDATTTATIHGYLDGQLVATTRFNQNTNGAVNWAWPLNGDMGAGSINGTIWNATGTVQNLVGWRGVLPWNGVSFTPPARY